MPVAGAEIAATEVKIRRWRGYLAKIADNRKPAEHINQLAECDQPRDCDGVDVRSIGELVAMFGAKSVSTGSAI